MFRPRILAIAVTLTVLIGFTSASAATVKKVLANPTLPTMIGTGEIVKVTAGRWSQKVTLTYQWLLDGKLISGATKTTYTVPVSALGHKLALVETAKFSDGKKLFATADSRVVGALKVTGAVTISRDDANKQLTLTAPSLTKTGVTRTNKWYASGSLIEAENNATLPVDRRYESMPVYAKVTYSAPGYTPLTMM